MPKKTNKLIRKVVLFFYRDTITQAQVEAVENHYNDFIVGFRKRVDRRDIAEQADVYAGEVPDMYRTRPEYSVRIDNTPTGDIYSGEHTFTGLVTAAANVAPTRLPEASAVATNTGVQGTATVAVAPTDAPKAPAPVAPAAPAAPAAPKAPTAPTAP